MKITIDRACEASRPCAKCRGTAQYHSDPVKRPAEAADGQLGLTATDMDMSIVETVACAIDQPGELTVAAQMIHEIVRKLPDGVQVELDTNGDSGFA